MRRPRGASGGECAALLPRFGRRYAALVRAATMVPVALIALPRAGDHRAVTGLVVGCVVVWSACYVVGLLRGRGSSLLALLVALDVGVVVAACASMVVTDAVPEANAGWVRLLATFACATYQWHTTVFVGAAATGVVAGALVSAHAVAGGLPVSTGLGIVVAAALSRIAWTLVRRGAATADRIAARASAERREREVAAAVRDLDRGLANALHDTAATTLLMVGTGQVPGDADWLAPQARRDLTLLRSYGELSPDRADLVRLLRDDLDTAPLPVLLSAPADLPLPFPVARAVADATRETLNNVVRHAGATRTTVDLARVGLGLRVTVTDDGVGFDPLAVPATRRGLRDCVTGRLAAVGGSATVESRPGHGTTVRLEWTDD